MKTAATFLDALRHRLLEGILLRLARRSDAADFVLRGGLLMRQWFRPVPRAAEDLDLVACFPFDVEETARRLLPALSDDVDDGVIFEVDRSRVEAIWLDTATPAVRVHLSGQYDAVEIDLTTDVTFGPVPRPAPVFAALPTTSGQPARVWMCRPEAVAGHKVQAQWLRGLSGWRPKDLNDLHLLLTRVPTITADLREAIAAYLGDVGATVDDARSLFGPSSWWSMKIASARWLDFTRSAQGRHAPRGLADIVAEVGGRLVPVLEGWS